MNDAAATRPRAVLRRALARPTVSALALVVVAELALVAGYLGLTGGTARSVRYLLYPFVWIDLAVWATFAVDANADPGPRARNAALAVASVYLLVLAFAGGVLDVSLFADGHGHAHGGGGGVDAALFTALPPGWGPTVVVESPVARATLVPYQVVGYLGLAYLTYVAVVDVAASALGGAVGLLSCASCSWPVFASLLAAALGGEAVASALYAYSLDLSTLAFVVAVALLAWRPSASGWLSGGWRPGGG